MCGKKKTLLLMPRREAEAGGRDEHVGGRLFRLIEGRKLCYLLPKKKKALFPVIVIRKSQETDPRTLFIAQEGRTEEEDREGREGRKEGRNWGGEGRTDSVTFLMAGRRKEEDGLVTLFLPKKACFPN